LLKKSDDEKLYTEIHQILKSKIPEYLPCEDNPCGIPLTTPVFTDGKFTIGIPGPCLTLTFGLLNPY
jgi:hypothetical protein